jgi:hypothetical protein
MHAYSHKRQVQRIMLSVMVLVVLVGSLFIGSAQSARAQVVAPQLFADAGVADQAADRPANTLRSRLVKVNASLLRDSFGDARGPGDLQAVELNLFRNANYIGVIDSVDDSAAESTAWIGHLDGIEGSYFYLVQAGRGFIAHVGSARGVYEVSSAGGGLYRVVQIDHSQMVDDPPNAKYPPPGPVFDEGDLGPNADSDSRYDVLVMYTDDARAAEGSTAAMRARVALAISVTNQAYLNAGIATRARLVHTEEVAYAESGNITTDKNRLVSNGDGFLDIAHTRRIQYGADIVVLITENGGGFCGLAAAILASANTAFQVTARSCATGNYSFPHENGHLQGMRHDTYVDSSTTPYSYGHGFVHTGTTASQRWRTVLAYNNRCVDLGYNCTRLQYFSNPHNVYNGGAMGNSVSQNYRVANLTDYTIANFRQQIIGDNFASSFNGSADGWGWASGRWALISGAYYYSNGLAGDFADAQHVDRYGDLTYTVRMRRTGGCGACSNHILIRGNPNSLNSVNEWSPSYMFQYTNNGSFSIYYITSAGTEVALKNWTASAAIAQNNWNTLKVVANGTLMKFYINNTLVWSVSNTSLKVGRIGFGFYRDANAATLYVDYANLSNTPTADINPNADVAPGVELVGGDATRSP